MTTSLGARYLPAWPDGTKHFKPAYVHTREELKVLIRQMNAERKAVQDRLRGIPHRASSTRRSVRSEST